MSILNKLTENVVERDISAENAALVEKWAATGLLEGLDDIDGQNTRSNMACLLENQAKELLREASSMAAGDVEGFAAVAFPIVRRVFGDLVANELVSVQPMSLPSGLIFFLDFVAGSTTGMGLDKNASLFGGGVVGSQITGGVNLSQADQVQGGFYDLNNGYSSPTGTVTVTVTFRGSGTVGEPNGDSSGNGERRFFGGNTGDASDNYRKIANRICRFDPDLSGTLVKLFTAPIASFSQLNRDNLQAIAPTASWASHDGGVLVRRLTQIDPVDNNNLLFVAAATASIVDVTTDYPHNHRQVKADLGWGLANQGTITDNATTYSGAAFKIPVTDDFQNSAALGSVIGDPTWGLEFGDGAGADGGVGQNVSIPEIDIKVDSIDIRAVTKKLKAKWTPELGQDLNAYHNIDAEVELTSILSEQIALEIDMEILEELVKGAQTTLYWSRRPGKFLDRATGQDLTANGSLGPDFTGNVSEWYETLLETINDVSAQIHRKTLRGGANFLVVSPEVANLLEFTAGFRGAVTHDDTKGAAGGVKVGTLSKKFDVYVSPYFPRNVVLVGRKGNSFLESGFVYAPYVPLQTTPLIYDPDTFVPNKGVMTRYGKKMVRPDMYGLVVVTDLVG